MEFMGFTYIDGLVLLLFAGFLMRGYRSGFWPYSAKVVSLIAGIVAALWAFAPLGAWLAPFLSMSPKIASVLGFVVVMIGVQAALDLALERLFRAYPRVFAERPLTKAAALIPAGIEAAIVGIMLVVVSTALPLPTWFTSDVAASSTGRLAAGTMPGLRSALDRASGGGLSAALATLTTHQGSGEPARSLPFKPGSTEVDEAAEARMLELVNEERAKVGAPPLSIDEALVTSARLHSRDMWERQYFAHENPDGDDPFVRMLRAGAVFLTAGENLALAPTVAMAHTGLMNSPGHRRNILDPSFHRVGIGIIDGGIFGKMVTQNFAN